MARYDPALLARLRQAAQIIADEAKRLAGRWSETIPGSVRVQGGGSRISVVAGGQMAPSAYTWEGKKSGSARYHPVYAHGPRDKWTWAPQLPVRPFMRDAVDAKGEEAFRAFADVIDDWAHERGFR